MNLNFRDEVPPIPMAGNYGQKPALSPKIVIGAIIGVLLIVIALMVSILSSSQEQPVTKVQRLSARLTSLQDMIDKSKRSITDPDLSKLSSDLSIVVAGSIAKLEAPMASLGAAKLSEDIKKAEADETTLAKLEEAKFTGVFDRAYVRIITQKLDSVLILLNEVFDDVNNNEVRTALKAIYNDFISMRKQFDEDINV